MTTKCARCGGSEVEIIVDGKSALKCTSCGATLFAIKEIDNQGTDEIVCPYCGDSFMESYEYFYSGNCVDLTCDKCGKTFEAVRDIEVSYTTWPKEDSPFNK